MTAPKMRRPIEELAQALYEASDPSGTAWVRRGRVVREPWPELARARMARSENRAEPDGNLGPNGKAAP
jgi:hypothetical protein